MKLTTATGIRALIVISAATIIVSCGNMSVTPNYYSVSSWKEGPDIAKANDQLLTQQQRDSYTNDAEILAVRYINKRDSTQTEIPNNLISLFYNGLVHIATSDLPEAREATNLYNVHALAPDPREIIVSVKTNTPWANMWENGNTLTGNNTVDELTNRFDFILSDYRKLNTSILVTLRSNRAINGSAVGRLFEQVDEIQYAGPDGIIGDGSDITVLFFNNYLQYNFSFGFGDCPSGCTSNHTWKFNVYNTGKVKFIGEEGPLPVD
ncbi:MAG TPA: hypothetical protein VJ964_07530 [Balneolaceae bacterium]|nr:hypothetical protein [Balneolaceae bacterium]